LPKSWGAGGHGGDHRIEKPLSILFGEAPEGKFSLEGDDGTGFGGQLFDCARTGPFEASAA